MKSRSNLNCILVSSDVIVLGCEITNGLGAALACKLARSLRSS